MHAMTMGTHKVRRVAIGAAAALALAVGAVGVAPVSEADARPRDGFHNCVAAGGNYLECLYWFYVLS